MTHTPTTDASERERLLSTRPTDMSFMEWVELLRQQVRADAETIRSLEAEVDGWVQVAAQAQKDVEGLREQLAARSAEVEALRKDGRNVCESLVNGYQARWWNATGCRCGSCRTFQLIDWEEKIVVEEEDQRDFLNAIAALQEKSRDAG